jgi:hypothetical protein
MENYIVNLDIAREMLARFRLAGRHIEPVFRLNGPVGEVFQAIRERVMRLMVNRQEKSAPETKPEPAKRGPFQVIHTDAICTLAGPTLEYSIVHRSAARGGKHHTEKRIDCHLFQSGKLPDAALDAPIASWLLARLCAEGGGVFDEPSERGSDGGGLVYDFLVREAKGKPVAGFQLSADTQRVQLTLNCDVAVDPQLVVQDFLALLLREPEKLAKCRVRICDPEWREMPHDYEPEPKRSTRNWYGWSGEKFYGADNVWDAQSVHHERPVAYREYLAASCEAGGE